jgi:hypothetical protein
MRREYNAFIRGHNDIFLPHICPIGLSTNSLRDSGFFFFNVQFHPFFSALDKCGGIEREIFPTLKKTVRNIFQKEKCT